jgi:hypothetical protein
MPRAVIHLRTWIPSELHEGFSSWCDDHHREQLRIEGFVRARRFELVSASFPDPPDLLTIYEIDDLAVLDSPAYLAHRETASALPETFAGRLTVMRRDCTIDASIPTNWWPAPRTAELDEFHLNDLDIIEPLRTIDATGLTGLDHDMVLRVLVSTSDDAFVLFDHGADDSEEIEDLVATSGATRSRWRCVFDERN